MYEPKISIIIPVYNGSSYLSQSIESALAQTYTNFEIIVVNDGSDDNGLTEEVAKRYKDKIRYYTKPNGGVSTALNYGIKKMSGKWFSWLSHDDIYLPNKLEKQISYLNYYIINKFQIKDISEIVLYSDMEFINLKSEIILKLKPIAKEYESTKETLLKNIKNNRLGGCSFLVHRDALEKMKGFNEDIRTVSDYDLWYRLLLSNYRFFYVPYALVQGRMHKKQVTYSMSDLGYQEFEQFHTWLLKQLDSKHEYNDYKIFYKISCYTRQRGYFDSSKIGFHMMKSRCSFIKYYSLLGIGIIYSDIKRHYKKNTKYIYSKIFIK